MKCPRCGSNHIGHREVGKRAGATVGGLVGAAVGTATALRGAQVGASLGAVGGPVGMVAGAVAGGLAGAIITGIFAGSAGCAVGSVAGNLADSNFLDNRACLDCGHTFREDSEPTAINVKFSATGEPGAPATVRGEMHMPRGTGFYHEE